jgi:hypothetical protein
MQLSPIRRLLLVLVLVLVLVLDPQLRTPRPTLAAPDARVPDDATPESADTYDYN